MLICARQRHARPVHADRRRRDPAAAVRLHELHRQHGVRLVRLSGEREHRLAVAEEAHAARGVEHVPAHERHGREMEAVAFPPEEAETFGCCSSNGCRRRLLLRPR